MAGNLDSAKSMLERAQVHSTTFKDAVMAFLDSDPFVQVNELDPESNEWVTKLKLVKAAPNDLNHIAADALVNMRSALDQAGYAVATAAGGKGRDTYFPFGDNEAEVRSRDRSGSKEIPKQIFDLMVSFKPYRGGDDFLWAMNKLCNGNKHRLLNAMASMSNSYRLSFVGNKGTGSYQLRIPRWDYTKNELELSRISPGKTDDYQIKMDVRTLVAFCEPEIVVGHPAEGVLNLLADKVGTIISAVDAEAIRIGLFK
ncbi:hypothetical protein NX774_10400 [Massilia agilis]|uniref:Uncharacterized protein n=1 Tax=Massilia agilis TaxID=1811226 RepID=A0ABT2DAJ1_9BURK|nr:hypothetical protein [Massilia agilis]MCS0808329.1 hypothetical protein [Massilia agilis]